MDCSFRLVAALLFVTAAQAHELDITVRLASPAVALRATYAGSEPVPFAKVQIYSPVDAKGEFQTGMTDRRGAFSFLPDTPGEWKVVIDDETGHRRELTVPVPAGFEGGATAPVTGGASRGARALLGVALIVGITGFWYGWRVRKG